MKDILDNIKIVTDDDGLTIFPSKTRYTKEEILDIEHSIKLLMPDLDELSVLNEVFKIIKAQEFDKMLVF